MRGGPRVATTPAPPLPIRERRGVVGVGRISPTVEILADSSQWVAPAGDAAGRFVDVASRADGVADTTALAGPLPRCEWPRCGCGPAEWHRVRAAGRAWLLSMSTKLVVQRSSQRRADDLLDARRSFPLSRQECDAGSFVQAGDELQIVPLWASRQSGVWLKSQIGPTIVVRASNRLKVMPSSKPGDPSGVLSP